MVQDSSASSGWSDTTGGGTTASGGGGGYANTLGFITQIFGGVWHQAGSGRMAARGAAAAAQKAAELAYNRDLLQSRYSQAWSSFARSNPYEPGFAVTSIENAQPGILKDLLKLEQRLAEKEALPQTHQRIQRERKIENKIGAKQAKLAESTRVRIAGYFGPNAGYWRERGAPPPLWLTQGSH